MGKNNDNFYKSSATTIPVVVHVVYHDSIQNISDSIIQTQIDVLNEDFGRYNADTINTPSIFLSVAANTNIQFCLAKRTPDNLPTNGITRTYTDSLGFTPSNNMKFDSTGGKNAWPRDQYLNIWVCNFANTSGGFALFPGVAANVDGAAIDYYSFGRNYIGGGRTATHEIGHWLGLLHTFQSGCGSSVIDSTNCSTTGDYICDTPPEASSTFTCPPTQNSCNNDVPDLPDMITNYMGYSYSSCKNMFTQGQADRMNIVLQTQRTPILTSPACNSFYQTDASAHKVLVPNNLACDSVVNLAFELLNLGTNTLTSVDINYQIDGGAFSTYNWNGNLQFGASINVNLNTLSLSSGIHNITIYTQNPNGTVDMDFNNDTLSLSFNVLGNSISHQNYNEDFENNSFLSSYIIHNPNSNNSWVRDSSVGGFGNSLSSFMKNNFDFNVNSVGDIDEFILPVLDFSNATFATLNFDVAYAKYSNSFYDSLIVLYSENCAADWNMLWAKGKNNLPTVSSSFTSYFTPTSSQWRLENISLDSLLGKSEVLIKFRNISGIGNNLYVDNINISSNTTTVQMQESHEPIMLVFPNPVTDNIQIQMENLEQIEISNMMGQIIFSRTISTKNKIVKVDFSDYNSGVYLIKGISKLGVIAKKILKE